MGAIFNNYLSLITIMVRSRTAILLTICRVRRIARCELPSDFVGSIRVSTSLSECERP